MVTGIFCFMERDSRTGQTLPDATLAASYPTWGERAERMPDKAFTPYPAGSC